MVCPIVHAELCRSLPWARGLDRETRSPRRHASDHVRENRLHAEAGVEPSGGLVAREDREREQVDAAFAQIVVHGGDEPAAQAAAAVRRERTTYTSPCSIGIAVSLSSDPRPGASTTSICSSSSAV